MAEPARNVLPPGPTPQRVHRIVKSVLAAPEQWIELSCPDLARTESAKPPPLPKRHPKSQSGRIVERSKEPVAVELRSIDFEDIDVEVEGPKSSTRPSRGGVARGEERSISEPRVERLVKRSFNRLTWLAFGVVLGAVATSVMFLLRDPGSPSEPNAARDVAGFASQPMTFETKEFVAPASAKNLGNGITPVSRKGKLVEPSAVVAGKIKGSKPNGGTTSASTKAKRAQMRDKTVASTKVE